MRNTSSSTDPFELYLAHVRSFELFTSDEEKFWFRELEKTRRHVSRIIKRIPETMDAILWLADLEDRDKSVLVHTQTYDSLCPADASLSGKNLSRAQEAAMYAATKAFVTRVKADATQERPVSKAAIIAFTALAQKAVLKPEMQTLLIPKIVELHNSKDPVSHEWAGRLHAINLYADQVKGKIAEANLRLVLNIAGKYKHRHRHFPEMVQAGNVGLVKAIEKFDVRLGNKFSTYAPFWIRKEIYEWIKENRVVHLPGHVDRKIGQIRSEFNAFKRKHHHTPDIEELAAWMKIPAEEILETLQSDIRPESLEAPIASDDGDGARLGDFIPDPEALKRVLDAIELQDMAEKLEKIFDAIPHEKARAILKMRLGIGYGEPMTCKEVGAAFKSSAQAVSQLELKARNFLTEIFGTSDLTEIVANKYRPAMAPAHA